MRGIPWRLLAAALATAILLDLPFPIAGPLPVWRTVFAWFALVPLLVELLKLAVRAPERRLRWHLGWSFLAGWLSGAVWFGANCYWVYDTMHLYGGMGPALAVFTLVLFSLYLGFWFGAFALALAVVQQATLGRRYAWLAFAAVPVLWTSMEFALARIPEFPWDLLGYSQVDNGLLMRLAPWTGVYGVSFLLAAVNARFAYERLRHGSNPDSVRRKGFFSYSEIGLLACVVLNLIVSGPSFFSPKPATTATAVLVQPNLNVSTDDVWMDPEWDRQIAQFGKVGGLPCGSYLAGLPETGAASGEVKCDATLPAPSLIAWPESPAPFRGLDPKFQAAMAGIATADKAPIIVGNVGMEEDAETQQTRIFNSASVVSQDGRFVGRYDKIHLVPFGEYVPMRHLLFFVRQVAQSSSDMSRGTERKTFRLNGHRYGIFICYESVFGDEVRQFARLGAEALVNISDDGWYGDTSAPWQHLNMARMRAIENRRWILRDTNNGVTAAIDPYGVVRQSIPRHQVGALAAQFGYSSEVTFYTEHGDWFAGMCAILGVGLLVWCCRRLLGEIASRPSVMA